MVERRNGFFETSFMPGRHFDLTGGLQHPVHRLARRPRTPGWCAPSRPARSTCSRPTRRRCCRCRRRCCTWAGATTSAWAATTTCASTPTTTPSTRRDRRPGRRGRRPGPVRVRHGGRLVAEHPRRGPAGMTVTDPAHVTAAAALATRLPAPDSPDPRSPDWSATWPTTTRPSGSISRASMAPR